MEMRNGVDPSMHPSELNNKQIVRLHQLFHEAKFKDPDGSHLSPAGERSLFPQSSSPPATNISPQYRSGHVHGLLQSTRKMS